LTTPSAKQAFVISGNFDSISSYTVTGTDASITFSSIPSTYTHLQVRGIARSNGSLKTGPIFVTVNGDTGTNYGSQGSLINHSGLGLIAYYDNAAPTYYAQRHTGSLAPSNYFGSTVFNIIDYKNTSKSKIFLGEIGGALAGATADNTTSSSFGGHWRNTNAITSITLTPNSGSWIAGTTFSLYGIV
jgi:hypothetical protein